jgi:hypothetical protein
MYGLPKLDRRRHIDRGTRAAKSDRARTTALEGAERRKILWRYQPMMFDENLEAEGFFLTDPQSHSTSRAVLVELEERDERFLWLASPVDQTAH